MQPRQFVVDNLNKYLPLIRGGSHISPPISSSQKKRVPPSRERAFPFVFLASAWKQAGHNNFLFILFTHIMCINQRIILLTLQQQNFEFLSKGETKTEWIWLM